MLAVQDIDVLSKKDVAHVREQGEKEGAAGNDGVERLVGEVIHFNPVVHVPDALAFRDDIACDNDHLMAQGDKRRG